MRTRCILYSPSIQTKSVSLKSTFPGGKSSNGLKPLQTKTILLVLQTFILHVITMMTSINVLYVVPLAPGNMIRGNMLKQFKENLKC